MFKRLRLPIAIVLAIVLGAIGWWALDTTAREPVYAGKPLSFWLDSLGRGDWQPSYSADLGSNTVPVLIKALERRGTLGQRIYQPLYANLPNWSKTYLSKPTYIPLTGRLRAATELMHMGKAAQPAIPALIEILRTDHDSFMRSLAASCLGWSQSSDPAVVAALTKSLHDINPDVCASAGNALKRVNPQAAAAAGVK